MDKDEPKELTEWRVAMQEECPHLAELGRLHDEDLDAAGDYALEHFDEIAEELRAFAGDNAVHWWGEVAPRIHRDITNLRVAEAIWSIDGDV